VLQIQKVFADSAGGPVPNHYATAAATRHMRYGVDDAAVRTASRQSCILNATPLKKVINHEAQALTLIPIPVPAPPTVPEGIGLSAIDHGSP
jgi:hypothetical protein